MYSGQVIALDPNNRQATEFSKAAGCARFAYNWALAEWVRQYRAGGKPSKNKLSKQFHSIKEAEFPWMYESLATASHHAFQDLGVAFKNFFDSRSCRRKGARVGYPQFKRKGHHDSFYVAKGQFKIDGTTVKLPVIGEVRMHHPLRLNGKLGGARVIRKAGRWFLCFRAEGEFRVPTVHKRDIIGVDLGVKTALVGSDGSTFDAPKPLKVNLQKLARANRRLHKRKKGSKNRKKAQLRVAKIYNRISNIRKDFIHKVTTQLCRENQTIVIEDLNVSGMLRNHKLARAIADVGFGEIRRQLEYKSKLFGNTLIVANRWFPSSKKCSCCGEKKEEMSLSERTYHCNHCGLTIDRDLNAALNLEKYPQLKGNLSILSREGRTLTETRTSTVRVKRSAASSVVEVGTIQEKEL